MNKHLTTIFLLLLLLPLSVFGESTEENIGSDSIKPNHDWLKIYYRSDGLCRINAHPVSEIDSVVYSAAYEEDGIIRDAFISVVANSDDIFTLPVDSVDAMILGGNIPTLYIDTNPYVDEITSKTEYTEAELRYVPYGDGTDSLQKKVSIRGRGNTSWWYPKKPYRLKFDKKQELAGLGKGKSFVLLSNYIDNTLMKNAVAMKVAQLVGLPYTNRIVPVNLVFNGMKRGSYMLTNKIGINAASVDIDEEEGILWELDANYDEEFKFRSATFDLPCMVQDPDFHEIADEDPEKIEELWAYWQNDLESAFQAVDEGRWQEAFDAEQLVKYILVQDIVLNGETGHPKSVFLYKEEKEGKYKFGPVWDFDWAFNYNYKIEYAIMNTKGPAFPFYAKIFDDEEFLKMFEEEFNKFCEESLEGLLSFIDDYASLIRDSALGDAMIWPAEHYNPAAENKERNTSRFDENVGELKEWILTRVDLIRNSPNFKLYQH